MDLPSSVLRIGLRITSNQVNMLLHVKVEKSVLNMSIKLLKYSLIRITSIETRLIFHNVMEKSPMPKLYWNIPLNEDEVILPKYTEPQLSLNRRLLSERLMQVSFGILGHDHTGLVHCESIENKPSLRKNTIIATHEVKIIKCGYTILCTLTHLNTWIGILWGRPWWNTSYKIKTHLLRVSAVYYSHINSCTQKYSNDYATQSCEDCYLLSLYWVHLAQVTES